MGNTQTNGLVSKGKEIFSKTHTIIHYTHDIHIIHVENLENQKGYQTTKENMLLEWNVNKQITSHL